MSSRMKARKRAEPPMATPAMAPGARTAVFVSGVAVGVFDGGGVDEIDVLVLVLVDSEVGDDESADVEGLVG